MPAAQDDAQRDVEDEVVDGFGRERQPGRCTSRRTRRQPSTMPAM